MLNKFALSELMPKKLTFGNVVLCEYVGQGSNNKHILVNTYSGNIIVGSLPSDLTFGLYAELLQPPGHPIDKIEVAMSMGGEVFMRGVGLLPAAHEASVFIIPLFQISVKQPGNLEVVFSADGYAPTTVLKKSISVGDVPGLASPNALSPPSEQSPPSAPASSKPRARRRPSSPKP